MKLTSLWKKLTTGMFVLTYGGGLDTAQTLPATV